MAHLTIALVVSFALASGLYGLGDLLTRRGGIGNRWVQGWTAIWWIVAFSAQFLGPRAGVILGTLAASVGFARVVLRWRESRRSMLVAGAALLVGAPLWLAPPHFYDALVYHLGLPWSWLVNGSFAPSDHNLFSHFPLAGSAVFLLPVAAGVPEAAAGLHWLSFALVLATVSRLAENLGASRWSIAAPILLAGAWHGPWMASLAGADHLVLLGIVVAAELWTSPPELGPRPWAQAGVALGFALSSKYTAALPVAAVLVAAFALGRPRREAVGAGALALVMSSFWWVRNVATVGNPFHPLLSNWFGGGGWSAEDYARYTNLVQEGVSGVRSGLVGALNLAAPSQLGVWLALAAFVALAAVFAPGSASRNVRVVALAALLAIVAWSMTAQTARYALPAAGLVAALAAAGLARLAPRIATFAAAAMGIAVGHGVLVLGFFLFGTLGLQRTWLGDESREAWRHAVTLNDPAGAYRAANDVLPRDARILIVGEGRSFGCPRRHDVSSPYDAQWLQRLVERSKSAEEVRRAVAEAGWTHLLFNWAELSRLGGDDYRMMHWRDPADSERYREFGIHFTERVWADGPLELRALRSEEPDRVKIRGARR